MLFVKRANLAKVPAFSGINFTFARFRGGLHLHPFFTTFSSTIKIISHMSQLFVDVAVPVAVDTIFSYSVPPELSQAAKAGVRVVVPFGKRTLTGFIVAVSHRKPDVPNIKSVLDIIDAEPLLSDELLYLTKWIADYYFAPLGEVLKTVLVQGSFQAGKRRVTLTLSGDQSVSDKNVSPKQMSIIRHLQEHGSLSISQIQTLLKAKSISKIINELAERGIVRIEEELPKAKRKTEIRAGY